MNVTPVVRLATFLPIDVSVTLRLRPNANILAVREAAQRWIDAFLDPYTGGLDGDGWPFGGTLYAADFARMVSQVHEARHVVSVQLFDMSGDRRRRGVPGWEEGEGADTCYLSGHDSFDVRRVRVRVEDASE